MRPIRKIFLHHSASSINTTREQIKSWHLKRQFSDIGYLWLILGNAELVAGRSMEKNPAAQKNHNSKSIAICTVGNFEESHPTEAQLYTLESLLFVLCRSFGLSSEDIRKHSNVNNTACPGKFFPFDQVLEHVQAKLDLN